MFQAASDEEGAKYERALILQLLGSASSGNGSDKEVYIDLEFIFDPLIFYLNFVPSCLHMSCSSYVKISWCISWRFLARDALQIWFIDTGS